MNILKKSALMGVALLVLSINVANASMVTDVCDPYTDGGHTMGKRDPYIDGGHAAHNIYTDSMHSMGVCDPYTDGGHQ